MNRPQITALLHQPSQIGDTATSNTLVSRGKARRRVWPVAGAMASLLIVTAACSSNENSAISSTSVVTTLATANTNAIETSDATQAIVVAANAFLDSLTAGERETVLFDFSDTTQRQNWSNLPEGLFQRSGLMWGNLDGDSQLAWLGVLQSVLSDTGYEQVYGEWHADDALAGGGGRLIFGSDYYWVAVIGEPSESTAWQFQFGGHHVTVNATIKGENISLTPSFIGAQPAVYDSQGKKIRPLGSIEDDAYKLVNSLDNTQISTAVLGDSLIDLVLGPGQDGKTIKDQGIVGANLTDEQKVLLLSLIAHYGGLVNKEGAAIRMAELKADLDNTYFAWYGPTDTSNKSGIYFRVTGPSIVIEYSGQEMGGSAADHIHGIYRDPTNDYGARFGAGIS